MSSCVYFVFVTNIENRMKEPIGNAAASVLRLFQDRLRYTYIYIFTHSGVFVGEGAKGPRALPLTVL